MPTDYTKSMADDVAAYLEEEEVARSGKSMYTNNLPSGKVDVLLITDTPGMKPEQYYAVDHPSVQVAYYAGAKNHTAGMTKIWECYHLLNRKQNIAIGSRDAMSVQAVQSPYCLGLDTEKNRWVFVFNVIFKIRSGLPE